MYFKNFGSMLYDYNIDTTYNVTAPNLEPGKKYTITSLGSTDFTKYGAKSNAVGIKFIATAVGTGTGVCTINEKRTDYVLVKDITQNVRVRTEILSNITLYDEYDIREGETPEIIAEKVYGNPNYHWVVMLCNQRYDYIDDFPLTQYELDKYITEKYGAGNEYATHHFADTTNGRQAESSVVSIKVTDPGSGYTGVPTVTIVRDPTDDDSLGTYEPAVAVATIISGKVVKIDIVNSGKGYIHVPTVSIAAPPIGVTATAQASIVSVGPVSNAEYEYQLNESKRRIKLISKSLLDNIIQNFKDVM